MYLCFTRAAVGTIIWNIIVCIGSMEGITAGVHRLWSHRSYKAKLPLQILLMLLFCVASQQNIVTWVRNHRLHHKFSDTDADPHNVNRGFFFSHMGWIMMTKNKEAKEKAKNIDISDITSNPVIMFHEKYVFPLIILLCYVIPTVVPMYFWGENFITAWHLNLLRFCYTTNMTLALNSIFHRFGYRPYDKTIAPTFGEGYHNYHHVFPYDYRSSEWGKYTFNATTLSIDFFEKIGWAYDLKSASPEVLASRTKRTGDGSDAWGSGRK